MERIPVLVNGVWTDVEVGPGQIVIREEVWTPSIAKPVLDEKNILNRKINVANLKEFENDMRNGRWRKNGQTIGFYRNGHLSDGQTRLTAIVNSGVSVPILSVFGIEEPAKKTIDKGKKRDLADQLMMTEKGNLWNRNAIGDAKFLLRTLPSHTSFQSDVERLLDSYHDDFAFVVEAITNNKSGLNKQGARAAFAYMMIKNPSRVDDIKAIIAKYNDGLNITSPNDPIARIREFAIMKASSKGASKLAELFRRTIYAIERSLAGLPCNRLNLISLSDLNLDGIFDEDQEGSDD